MRNASSDGRATAQSGMDNDCTGLLRVAKRLDLGARVAAFDLAVVDWREALGKHWVKEGAYL